MNSYVQDTIKSDLSRFDSQIENLNQSSGGERKGALEDLHAELKEALEILKSAELPSPKAPSKRAIRQNTALGVVQDYLEKSPLKLVVSKEKVTSCKNSPAMLSVVRPEKQQPAAINPKNIQLIFLRRSLLEELSEEPDFPVKVLGAYVRIRVSGKREASSYRLVHITGATIQKECDQKTRNIALDVMNLNQLQQITLDVVSNENFTEEECQRLRQCIQKGLILAPTVGELEQRAAALQEAKANAWFTAEIVRMSNLRDRASELGRKKEYPFAFQITCRA